MTRIDLVVGARPNFVKVAPVYRALTQIGSRASLRLIHTGQHYDASMSEVFFQELEIPRPDVFLGVGSGEHGAQTGAIITGYEPVLQERRPDLVLVFGDVNSTMACALTAVKQGVRVGHVEAGLRSFDRSMPEEINRVVTDHISDLLFTPSRDADENLIREGVASEKIHFVGNVMIDTLVAARPRIAASLIMNRLVLEPAGFGVVTLHRPSNVDGEESMTEILRAMSVLQEKIPLVFPVHPRTRKRLAELGARGRMAALDRVLLLDPLPYCDFLRLVSEAAFVLTDSGGIQEETTFLDVPCLTARPNTERPVTIAKGTNRLVGSRAEEIVQAVGHVLNGGRPHGRVPPLWDGHAAHRIAGVIREQFTG